MKINEYSPGLLVKNNRQNDVGVLIEKDFLHKLYWRAFSSKGMSLWFEPNFEEVKLNESSN